MKTHRFVVDTISTAYGDNPEWMGIIASTKDETVEIVFETMKTPLIAGQLISTGQDALQAMDAAHIGREIEWNIDGAAMAMPDAIDVGLAAGGDALCINIGTGALFFHLTDAAKKALKNL